MKSTTTSLMWGMCLVVMSPWAMAANAEQTLLPESYAVYSNGTTVLNHPEAGFTEALLPTVNLYKGSPGCYIACYSRQKDNAIYAVAENIYVLGQVRIAGRYNNSLCEPTNFAGKDISGEEIFKTICSEKIPACIGKQCWAGGDTGGWFGLPAYVPPSPAQLTP